MTRRHLADQFGVERRGGLVEQHHLRPHRERPRDGGALLLAARQMGRILVPLVGDADLGEQRLGFRDAFGLGPLLHVHRRLDDILQDRSGGTRD